MPELPEVETTLRGIAPHLAGQVLTGVAVRIPRLRTAIPATVAEALTGATIQQLHRRNKYLLLTTDHATTLLIHLGMSGRLSVHPRQPPVPLLKHDHISLFTATEEIRFNDARRFGLFVLIPTADLASHPLLAKLGPEPLERTFTGPALHKILQRYPAKSLTPIKVALMDNHNVVGIGNIYASESLFRAKIHPQTPARTLTAAQCLTLVTKIKETLKEAIAAGGSSLRDFQHANGNLGYFQKSFFVYGRKGEKCLLCTTPIQNAVLAQRNTFWCATCQLPSKTTITQRTRSASKQP